MTDTTSQARPTGRLAQLLEAMASDGGHWTTNKALNFYRAQVRSMASMPHGHVRGVARGDLRDLAAWGWLTAHDKPGYREYSVNLSTPGEPS